MTFLFRIFACVALLFSTALAQKGDNGQQLTKRTLLADTTAVEGGKPFRVGFRFEIADHWHTYWKFAGAPGEPFKVAAWKLPEGWKAGDVEFPNPVAALDPNGWTMYAYEHEVVYTVLLTPPADVPAGEVTIAADITWQVCADTCIPGKATVELKIPAGKSAPANEELFKKWQAQMPLTTPAPSSSVTLKAEGAKNRTLSVRVAGVPPDAKAEFFPVPPEGYGGTFELDGKLTSNTEGDARVFTYPFDSDLPAGSAWQGLLVLQKGDGPREGWMVKATLGGDGTSAAPVAKPANTAAPVRGPIMAEAWDPFDEIKKEQAGLWTLLLQGFLGGLLLNLMPCVLPVISLKIFGFLQQAGEAKDRVFRLGLAFCAGVFVFFMLLAGLVVGLASAGKSFGWGAQFSNPVLLAAMLGVVFLFGLSLLGVFEITLGGGEDKLSQLSSKEGFGGAFVHGFFTTLLGTSCTAPLVGPVIGAAITRPGPQVFALFAAIAVGLALPYFLLTWHPAWMRFLPKPGMWMVRFKQLLGFVMLGLVVWLLGSLATTDLIVQACAFLLVLAFAAWMLGTWHTKKWALPMALAFSVLGWFAFVHGKMTAPAVTATAEKGEGELTWEPYSVGRIQQALKADQPVFIDFTAKWCLNCKVFEATVINTEPVTAALQNKKVLTMKADYTSEPPEIADALRKLGRAGVPVYVLFRKRGDAWVADGLTQAGLLEELNKL